MMDELERRAQTLAIDIVMNPDFVVIQDDGRPLLRGPVIEPLIRAALSEFGAAALRAERARALKAVEGQANALPADVDDGFYTGYKLAIKNALAALRALD